MSKDDVSKHTPGPWHVIAADGYIATADGEIVAETPTTCADTDLIAAAPDLYEALEAARIALDDWLNDFAHDLCDQKRVAEARARIREYGTIGYIAQVQLKVRAALALARGKQP